MKKSILVLVLTIFGFTQNAFLAQKAISLSEFSVQNGFTTASGNQQPFGAAEFSLLAPNSSILNLDLSGFDQYQNFVFNRGGNNRNSGIYVGLKLNNFNKNNFLRAPVIRLGLHQESLRITGISFYNEVRTPYDTLISTQTGNSTYVDSVSSTYIGMEYFSNKLALDAAIIFQTTDNYRFSFHSGIGFNAGLTYNNRTEINQNNSTSTISYGNNSNGSSYYSSYYDGYGDYQRESITNKNGFFFSAYVPLGIDLRLGKNREFWKHVNLFLESRPSINFQSIPEVGTQTSMRFSGNLGLKLTW
jgi:hypothetical protein